MSIASWEIDAARELRQGVSSDEDFERNTDPTIRAHWGGQAPSAVSIVNFLCVRGGFVWRARCALQMTKT